MDVRYLKKLIQIVESSGISELEIEDGGSKVRISKSQPIFTHAPALVHSLAHSAHSPNPETAPPPAAEKAPAEKKEDRNLVEVASPMVGTFYRASRPGVDPYVDVGEKVEVGQILCILEAMKIMNELESEVAGIIREVCVENGQPVEFGQRLFLVEPAGR